MAKSQVKAVNEPANRNESSSIELVQKHVSQELVFGIVGHVGSGTSMIAEQLEKILEDLIIGDVQQDTKILKARKVIESWATSNGEKLPRNDNALMANVKVFQDLGDKMRSAGDHAAVARGMVRQIRETRASLQDSIVDVEKPVVPDGKPRAYILDSIRHPAEVNLLRRIYGEAFVLIGVVCEHGVREKRISQKYRDAGLDEASEFMKRDAKASQKHGQRVSDAFHLSDYFIDNTASRFVDNDKAKSNEDWEVPDHIERLIKLVTHLEIERPSVEETAMYAAGGAAMRSACLSRQVGSSVLDKKGNIVATGANEAPKAGGGVYGELNHSAQPDDRCFVQRQYCSNTKEQNKIASTLAEEIASEFEGVVEIKSLTEKIGTSRIGELLEFSRAVHAEMDALLEAGRKGVSTIGCKLFVTTFPCHYCARHIVSAGIDEVQYIEPYPKSKAFDLHGDSIQNDVSEPDWIPPSEGGAKVLFKPFTGVAPRMYRRAFQKDRQLKDSQSGKMSIGLPEWGSPYDISKSSYAEFELSLTKDLTW